VGGKTVTEHIRAHLLKGLEKLTYEKLKETEWSPRFEALMRNRLIFGAIRYGCLNAPGKPQYDRAASIANRLAKYTATGNLEHLVDIANLAMCEFEEGQHPRKHFKSIDDGEHVQELNF
jgi:hypothetical protein